MTISLSLFSTVLSLEISSRFKYPELFHYPMSPIHRFLRLPLIPTTIPAKALTPEPAIKHYLRLRAVLLRDLRSFEILFEFESVDPIRFDSKVTGWFEIFESAAPVLPSYRKPRSLFNKKNFNRCAVVIEIYFMFMILCLRSKSIHTR